MADARAAPLQDGRDDLARRARVGRRLEHQQRPRRDVRGRGLGPRQHGPEVRVAMVVEGCRQADDDRLAVAQTLGTGRRAEVAARGDGRQGGARDVLDVRAALGDGDRLARVDVDPQDVIASFREGDREGQPDVAESDDADACHGSGRYQGWVGHASDWRSRRRVSGTVAQQPPGTAAACGPMSGSHDGVAQHSGARPSCPGVRDRSIPRETDDQRPVPGTSARLRQPLAQRRTRDAVRERAAACRACPRGAAPGAASDRGPGDGRGLPPRHARIASVRSRGPAGGRRSCRDRGPGELARPSSTVSPRPPARAPGRVSRSGCCCSRCATSTGRSGSSTCSTSPVRATPSSGHCSGHAPTLPAHGTRKRSRRPSGRCSWRPIARRRGRCSPRRRRSGMSMTRPGARRCRATGRHPRPAARPCAARRLERAPRTTERVRHPDAERRARHSWKWDCSRSSPLAARTTSAEA